MNEIFTPPPMRPPTQAAGGLPRWRWRAVEIESMAAAGYFHELDRFELLGGEIVPMSPKGRRHEIVRAELAYRFTRLAPESMFVVSEPQIEIWPTTPTRCRTSWCICGPPRRPTWLAATLCSSWRSRTRALPMTFGQGAALCRARRARVLGRQCRDPRRHGASAAVWPFLRVHQGVCARHAAGAGIGAGTRGDARRVFP